MRRVVVSLGVLALLSSACHSTDGPSDPFVGHWVGGDGSITWDVTLNGKSAALNGSGSATGPGVAGGEIDFTVAGTDQGSACALTFEATGFAPVMVSGEMGRDTITATLNGGGFSGYVVSLARSK